MTKNKYFTIRIDPETLEALKKAAAKHETTMSKLALIFIKAALKGKSL